MKEHLFQDGYVLLSEWQRNETTVSVGQSMGVVADINTLQPQGDIPIVQTLRPRTKGEASKNLFSGNYGLDEFPLHTDLAHWAIPPRYLMLRCQKGSQSVATNLLVSSTLESILGTARLRRALVRPRRVAPNDVSCLLPIRFSKENIIGFRWDPLFVVPMNKAAEQIAEIMNNHVYFQSEIIPLHLEKHGDTLIIDNWRCLHGRSKISTTATDRRIERIYLSEVYT